MKPRATSISRDLGFDDQSVDFSVDPDMYTKLDIKKAKLGEENAFDIQKIYQFQLEKDIKKINAVKGPYRVRNQHFLDIRKTDAAYREVAVPAQIATHGNFVEILEYTTEESWKATSRPYGEQAHKRYLDYLANIPKGPSDDEVRDKLQRAMDKELWEKIITGKTEPTKKELRQKEREAAERLEKMLEEKNELDHHKKRRIWKENILSNTFEQLRVLPTETEFYNSLDKWHKGIHYPYDMENGYPYVNVGILEGTEMIKDRNNFETMEPTRIYSSKNYIEGNEGTEQSYREHMININLNKVDKYLKQRKREMVREEQMAEELRQIQEKQRRRVGKVERHDIADAIVHAKFNTIQSGNIQIKKLELKAPGQEGKENEGKEDEEDEWSFSDSSGGFGNHQNDKENTEKGDTEEAGVYRREHKSVLASDVERLNEALQPKTRRKAAQALPPLDTTQLHNAQPSAGSPSKSRESSPARRGVVNIPAFAFDAHGNPVVSQDSLPLGEGSRETHDGGKIVNRGNHSKGTPRRVGFETSQSESSQKERESGKKGVVSDSSSSEDLPFSFSGEENALPSDNNFAKSTKYSDKYFGWARAGVEAMNIPDFMKDTFSTKETNVAPLPVAGSAYKVKNYKQRHIAVRVVIHYVKKLHPKRLLYQVVRGFRAVRKAYKKHFSNPENITRSERRKQQRLRKLDHLMQDASSKDYHNSIVALAEHEIPSEEYLPYAKRKKRFLLKEIAKLQAKGNLNADEKLQLEALQTRLTLHNEAYEARLAREKAAAQKVGLIQRYISDTHQQIEATSNFSFLDRQRIRIRNMKQDLVQRAVELKAGKKQEHILPAFSKAENDDIIIAMHDARLEDRKKSAWKRKYRRRWNYFLTGDKRFLVDEDEKVRDVDDLILAARAGNYIEVMDIVMHPTDPVSPNDCNEDGMNAIYATLQMILKREVLDSETDLARLHMTKFQRFVKALSRTKDLSPKLDLVLRALLYTGGNVDHKFIEPGVDGLAIMHLAAQAGAIEMIDWLLKKGTDVNIRSALQQKTPLMFALEFNQLDTVSFLLRRGVMMSLELQDVNGWTALHYAAVYARPELAVIMLICGANIAHRNKNGRLATEEARSRGRNQVATAIMTYKSDVVEVRTRIDNLMNHTDNQYKQRHKKHSVHRQPTRDVANANGDNAPMVENASLAGSNSVGSFGRQPLPPIRGHLNGPDQGSVHRPSVHAVDPHINTETQDLSATLPPADRAAQREAALLQERQERDAYERRISSLVASKDPWNLAPHTKPRPSGIGIAKMSFYSKSNAMKQTAEKDKSLPPVHPKGNKK